LQCWEVWIVKSSAGGGLPSKTKNRVWWARYWCAMDAISGDHGGGVLAEGEVVVAGLGGVDGEIERREQFCPVKPKSDRASSILLGG
jgi:hypothetical protein